MPVAKQDRRSKRIHHEEHEGHEEWSSMSRSRGYFPKGIHEAQLLTYMKLAGVKTGLPDELQCHQD